MKVGKQPIVVKVEDEDVVKREVTANVVDKEEELFLYGRKTLIQWKPQVFFEENILKSFIQRFIKTFIKINFLHHFSKKFIEIRSF